MLELVRLLFSTLDQIFRSRHDLVLEDLLLRHQLGSRSDLDPSPA